MKRFLLYAMLACNFEGIYSDYKRAIETTSGIIIIVIYTAIMTHKGVIPKNTRPQHPFNKKK